MTHGSLQRFDQTDIIVDADGKPTIRFQTALEELAEHVEDVEEFTAGANIAALNALDATPGLLAQTGAGTFAKRTLTGPAAGISVSNGNGAAANPSIALANDTAALEGLTGTGLARRTGTDTWELLPHSEGTFSPVLRINNATTGITYSEQLGRYARIGALAFVAIRIALTSKGALAGAVTIGGLPFQATALPTGTAVIVGATFNTVASAIALVAPSSSVINLYDFTSSAAADLTAADLQNTTVINFSIVYSV